MLILTSIKPSMQTLWLTYLGTFCWFLANGRAGNTKCKWVPVKIGRFSQKQNIFHNTKQPILNWKLVNRSIYRPFPWAEPLQNAPKSNLVTRVTILANHKSVNLESEKQLFLLKMKRALKQIYFQSRRIYKNKSFIEFVFPTLFLTEVHQPASSWCHNPNWTCHNEIFV